MNAPAPIHGGFTIKRIYHAPVAKVFAAFSTPDIKAQWFVGPPGWTEVKRELDFRVGGRELLHGRFDGGGDVIYAAHFYDIVPNQRIVYAYHMTVKGAPMSVSLATLAFTPDGDDTKMIFTEQAVYLDGKDGNASRERGTGIHFDNIAEVLE